MKQVLIVDDSKQIRGRLSAMLSESSQIHIIGQAGNYQEALDVMQRQTPDIIVLDICLPGRSGIELLKEIKARRPAVTVIMLTNYDYEEYRRQCEFIGADHFLNKALEFDKIADIIEGKQNQ